MKMIDEVKVPPADLRLNSEKVAPKAFVKVKALSGIPLNLKQPHTSL